MKTVWIYLSLGLAAVILGAVGIYWRNSQPLKEPASGGDAVGSPLVSVGVKRKNPAELAQEISDARQTSDPRERSRRLKALLLRGYGERLLSLEEALQMAEDLQLEDQRHALALLAIHLADEDPKAAVELVVKEYGHHSGAQSDAISNIYRRLVGRDMPTAVALLELLPPGALRHKAVGHVATAWPTTNVDEVKAGVEWAASIALEEDRELAFGRIAQDSAKLPVSEIDLLLQDLSAPEFRRSLIRFAAGQITKSNPQDALDWVARYESDGDFISSIIQTWASVDPQAAGDYVLTLDDEAQLTSLSRLVGNNFSQNPKGASDWALEVGHRLEDFGTLQSVLHSWMHHNSLAASEWVAALSEGPAKNAAINSMVRYLDVKGESPEVVESWIQQITDQDSRETLRDELQEEDPLRN